MGVGEAGVKQSGLLYPITHPVQSSNDQNRYLLQLWRTQPLPTLNLEEPEIIRNNASIFQVTIFLCFGPKFQLPFFVNQIQGGNNKKSENGRGHHSSDHGRGNALHHICPCPLTPHNGQQP